MKPTIDPPRCPLHHRPMRLIPRLPELKHGRGRTAFNLKLRQELNAAVRYRCTVEGCPYVAAISTESTNESAN